MAEVNLKTRPIYCTDLPIPVPQATEPGEYDIHPGRFWVIVSTVTAKNWALNGKIVLQY